MLATVCCINFPGRADAGCFSLVEPASPHLLCGTAAAAPARRGVGDDDSVEVQLQDLVALLERDPRYAKGPLVYQLLEADGR